MKSYVFRVVLEHDEDVWRAVIPELEAQGAATWGKTREEALRNIQEASGIRRDSSTSWPEVPKDAGPKESVRPLRSE